MVDSKDNLYHYHTDNKYYLAEPIFQQKKPGSRVVLDVVKQLQQTIKNTPHFDHEHYLKYQEIEQINGEYCLIASTSTEYSSLKDFLNRNNPSLQEKLQWALDIAEVAQKAEENNCNWPGLTLHSLKVDVDKNIKVVDPEITAIIKQYQLPKVDLNNANFTPPEIMKNEKWDQQSRLYNFGVILYYFCTGQFPFSGKNNADILDKVLNSSILEPRFINHQLSLQLNELILQLLVRKKEKRISTWKQLLTQLRYICHNNLIEANQIQQNKNQSRGKRTIKIVKAKEKFSLFFRRHWQAAAFITLIAVIIATTIFTGNSNPVITSETSPEQVVKHFYNAINEKNIIVIDQTTDLKLGRLEGMISEGHVIEKMRQAYPQNPQDKEESNAEDLVFGIKDLNIDKQKAEPEVVFAAKYVFYINLPEGQNNKEMKDTIILEYKDKWQIIDIKGDLQQLIKGELIFD